MSRLQMNPWFSMWTRPRKTIQAIIEFKPGHRFFFLSAIVGWPAAIQVAQLYSLSETLTLPLILLITIVSAPFLGAIGLVIYTSLVYLMGKIFKGSASFSETRAAVAWSNITGIFSVLCYATLISYFRGGWFSPAWINMPVDRYMAYILFCLFFIQIVSIGWTIYLLVLSVSQVQRFSVWKSIGTLVLSGIVLLGVIQFLS